MQGTSHPTCGCTKCVDGAQAATRWVAIILNKYVFYTNIKNTNTHEKRIMNPEGEPPPCPHPFLSHPPPVALHPARSRLTWRICLTVRFRASTETKIANELSSAFLKLTSKMSAASAEQCRASEADGPTATCGTLSPGGPGRARTAVASSITHTHHTVAD